MMWGKTTGFLDLLNLQTHKTCMVGLGGRSCGESPTLCILKSFGMFDHELTMSSMLVLRLICFRAPDLVKCLGKKLCRSGTGELNCILLLGQLSYEGVYFLG